MSSIHPKTNLHTMHVRFGIQANGYLSATMSTANLMSQIKTNPIRAKLINSSSGRLFMEFGKDGSLGVPTTSKTTRFIFTPKQLNFKHGTIRVHAKTVDKIRGEFNAANPAILNFVEELPEKIQQRNKPRESELALPPTKVVATMGQGRNLEAEFEAAKERNILTQVTDAKTRFNKALRRASELGLDIQVGVNDGEIVLSVEL